MSQPLPRAGASNYTFDIPVTAFWQFLGSGIIINGGSASITNNGSLNLDRFSTAGNASITNNGVLQFSSTVPVSKMPPPAFSVTSACW